MATYEKDVYLSPNVEIVNVLKSDIIVTSNVIDDNLPDDTWQ